ncbi:Gly-Xaa carboxypeptidase, partial [Blyttiomyces sp. JEL0837]
MESAATLKALEAANYNANDQSREPLIAPEQQQTQTTTSRCPFRLHSVCTKSTSETTTQRCPAFVALRRVMVLAVILFMVSCMWSSDGEDGEDYQGPGLFDLLSSQTRSKAYQSCGQTGPLVPSFNKNLSLERFLDEKYRAESAERLAGAIRIQTTSYDKWRAVSPPEDGEVDEDHKGFLLLHKYLEKQFPLLHKNLERVIINRFSLLFIWKGTNYSQDKGEGSLILCAHMDVVPVLEASASQWLHEPWSGDVEDGWIWGRGTADTKCTLVATMEGVEMLLKGGFKPAKTVILAFGHDEEISGFEGAKRISKYLQDELGMTGKAGMLVDEGTGINEVFGVKMGLISTGEKGYMDTEITIETTGGHASIPPSHTGIGLIADAIVRLEANPHVPQMPDNNPYLGLLTCVVDNGGSKVDPWLKWAINHIDNGGRSLLVQMLSKQPQTKYMMATSQAVDVINGGVKVNALPEVVKAFVNQRIAVHESVAEVEEHWARVVGGFVAGKHHLNFTLFPHVKAAAADANDDAGIVYVEYPDAKGAISIKTWVGALEPSPVSPVGDAAWNVLEDPIYAGEGVHTVNERISVEA